MFEDIRQAAFEDELEKIAIAAGNRVIKRGERHMEELSKPISTKAKKRSVSKPRVNSTESSSFKIKHKTGQQFKGFKSSIF